MPTAPTPANSNQVLVDVGSNTIHALLLQYRATPADQPRPDSPPSPWHIAQELKISVRLGTFLTLTADHQRYLTPAGVQALLAAFEQVQGFCQQHGLAYPRQVRAFATSAVRDCTNSDQVMQALAQQHGVNLEIITGQQEARLTYQLAAGWQQQQPDSSYTGKLALLDIGGGSVEIASGQQDQVQWAVSMPIGTAWLTNLPHPAGEPIRVDNPNQTTSATRMAPASRVCQWWQVLQTNWQELLDAPASLAEHLVVGTSKTLRTLAQLSTADPAATQLAAEPLAKLLEKLPQLLDDPALRERFDLSPGRAQQTWAGAVLAQSFMQRFAVPRILICPVGSLREAYLAYAFQPSTGYA